MVGAGGLLSNTSTVISVINHVGNGDIAGAVHSLGVAALGKVAELK